MLFRSAVEGRDVDWHYTCPSHQNVQSSRQKYTTHFRQKRSVLVAPVSVTDKRTKGQTNAFFSCPPKTKPLVSPANYEYGINLVDVTSM